MVHVWTSIGQQTPDTRADANILRFYMEMTPEEVSLLGTDPEKIAAKIIAAQNYLSWLFSAQGAQDQDYARTGMPKGSGPARAQGDDPHVPYDKDSAVRRALKVFEDELERAKASGNPKMVKAAEDAMARAKKQMATPAGKK